MKQALPLLNCEQSAVETGQQDSLERQGWQRSVDYTDLNFTETWYSHVIGIVFHQEDRQMDASAGFDFY